MRVLRARGYFAIDGHGGPDSRFLPAQPRDRRNPPHDVRRPHKPHSSSGSRPRRILRGRIFKTVIPRSVRLAEAPATASPSFSTTSAPKAPKATSNSQKKYSRMTKGPDQRKALGKGLSALLPGATRAEAAPSRSCPPATANSPSSATDRCHRAEPRPTANRLRRRSAKRTGAVNSRQRHHPAIDRAPRRRSVPAGRRRAPLAGSTTGWPDRSSGLRPGFRARAPSGSSTYREHSARRLTRSKSLMR